MQKATKYITPLVPVLAALVMQSCSGYVDDTGSILELEADKTAIAADGTDQVRFTVRSGETDITSEAAIRCITDGTLLQDAVFSTNTSGTYTFRAEYDGKTSETLSITAGDSQTPGSEFKRNYFIAEITEAYCTFCPEGANFLLGYFCREVIGFDNACVVAFHDNSLGDDPMAISVTSEITSDFSLFARPSYAFDMRVAGDLMNERAKLMDAYEESRDDYPAICGLSITSSYDETARSADVTVSLKSAVSSTFRVALFVVEDNVVSFQKDPTGADVDNYNHRHVARKMLSSSYKGDNWGELAAGQEMKRDFSVTMDEGWNHENITVCALAYDSSGYVNNCLSCTIDGTADYEYN